MKCNTCGNTIKVDCDWQQGRCPHTPPMFSTYQMRYYNLLTFIKSLFQKKER
jgi:hypothetical protein